MRPTTEMMVEVINKCNENGLDLRPFFRRGFLTYTPVEEHKEASEVEYLWQAAWSEEGFLDEAFKYKSEYPSVKLEDYRGIFNELYPE